MGRAKCDKHDLITDFANHGKFKRLDTCEDYEPQESEAQDERTMDSEAEHNAKDLAKRICEQIAEEANYIYVDRKRYFEKVVQFMKEESEEV